MVTTKRHKRHKRHKDLIQVSADSSYQDLLVPLVSLVPLCGYLKNPLNFDALIW
jgi:hypothetical protein